MNASKISALTITTAFFVFAAEAPTAADAPLAAFAGNWAGSGAIVVKDGSKERIRCRATNSANGNALNLAMKCASDSYKFELSSNLNSSGNNISGNWSETTRGVYGQLSGAINGGQIHATASAGGINATLAIVSRGNSLSVSIKSPGSEVAEVTVSMAHAR